MGVYTTTEFICCNCGKHFIPKKNKHTAKLCSRECLGQWNSKHRSGSDSPYWKGGSPTVTCAACGATFKQSRSKAKRNKMHFCNRACKAAWMSIHIAGPVHPNWTGGKVMYRGPNWHAQARATRKRDGYKCCACGKTQKQNKKCLDVHHVQPFKTFGYILGENDHYIQANELTNLVSLCATCHRKVEHGSIAIQPYLL